MNKKIQAIVKVNGVETFFFYDEEIERIVSNSVTGAVNKDDKVETELISPPMTYDELKARRKQINEIS